MPVEIFELVVKATINDQKEETASQTATATAPDQDKARREAFLRTTELVAAILKRQKER